MDPKLKTMKSQRFTTNYDIDDHLLTLSQLSEKYKVSLNEKEPQTSQGLNSDQIPVLEKIHGRNILSPPKTIPEWRKFLHHLLDLFNILLFIGGVLSFIAYLLDPSDTTTIYLGCFLFFIVIFDATIGYLQERSSSNVMGKFKKMLPPQCTVIRDGAEKLIQAENVVVGDLIKIQGGNKIPADIRIVFNRGLKVEQSALNGESEPVEISERSLNDHFIESRNIVFNGCLCLEGLAYGLAIKTGDNTYLGIIAQQTAQIVTGETPLQIEIKRFVKFISILGITLGTIVFSIGAVRGTSNFLNLFVQGFIIVIIANIPQGLPATVVSCLTIIAYRMSKQNVYIKKLESIETLGSATVIASDKTGTLTMNQMTVEHVWFDSQIYSADFIRQNEREFKKNKVWHKLFQVGVLCNKAFYQKAKNPMENDNPKVELSIEEGKSNLKEKFIDANELKSDEDPKDKTLIKSNSVTSRNLIRKLSKVQEKKIENLKKKHSNTSIETVSENSEEMIKELKHQQSMEMHKYQEMEDGKETRKNMQIVGDATESAILRFCEIFKQTDDYREKHKKVFELPFNSTNKFQLSVHQFKDSRFLVMKGAPEIIFSKCVFFFKNGKQCKMNDSFKEDFEKSSALLGRKGMRVLGCAFIDLGKDAPKDYSLNTIPFDKLCFVGLYSLMDPPKKGVAEAIMKAKHAGIKVFMITGDHPLTAEAIARKVNLIQYETIDQIAEKSKCDKSEIDPNMALAAVVSGSELKNFTEENWKALLLSKRELVFARISPQQKVEIVENLQKLKEIVIVTGDGVNDAIALKQADIGVAMGKGGTDVAKEAAEVIFIDDNFESIVSGIREGRTLFDNLKKTIVYTLTHCILELAPILLNVSVGLPLGNLILCFFIYILKNLY